MKRINYFQAHMIKFHSLGRADFKESIDSYPMVRWCDEHESPGRFAYVWMPETKETFWFERFQDAVMFRLMFDGFKPLA